MEYATAIALDRNSSEEEARVSAWQRTLAALSARERQVADLIAKGLATKEVAAALAISTHTVRHHTERVFRKLGVQNRSAVVALLLSDGRVGYSAGAGFLRLED
jgi:DNA-binding CsgD family transcriptional regulator